MGFLKREGKNDAIVAGMAVGDMREKEYDGKKFYEVPVSLTKDSVVNVAVWNRKPEEIKKYDHVLAFGEFKQTQKDDKTFYSLTADFIMKENASKVETSAPADLQPVDDDNLPF